MTAMVIGTVLALGALTFVLYPLFQDTLEVRPARSRGRITGVTVSAVDALREIEFDHATGKLSESDYASLKASYTQRAVAAMRGEESGTAVCGVCGPRPELDAAFCSECGRQLMA